MNQTVTKMGDDLPLFEGETFLHLGKKHTFNDIAKAVLEQLRGNELEIFKIALDVQQRQDWYLIQETQHYQLVEEVKARRGKN